VKLKNQIAVITADVVNSSLLSEAEMKFFQEKIESYKEKEIVIKPRFYRGDSFQLAVNAKEALLLAIKFRMEIKQWKEQNDVRISIGIGEVSQWNDDVLLAAGSAFERSGKNLDNLKKTGLNIIIVTGNVELDEELETYCYMADEFIKNQTAVQATLVFQMLNGIQQIEIAKMLEISQPSVSKSLKAANWKLIERFLKRYQRIIQKNYATA
jgi:predicted XRE-type DNA-binding protein